MSELCEEQKEECSEQREQIVQRPQGGKQFGTFKQPRGQSARGCEGEVWLWSLAGARA